MLLDIICCQGCNHLKGKDWSYEFVKDENFPSRSSMAHVYTKLRLTKRTRKRDFEDSTEILSSWPPALGAKTNVKLMLNKTAHVKNSSLVYSPLSLQIDAEESFHFTHDRSMPGTTSILQSKDTFLAKEYTKFIQ